VIRKSKNIQKKGAGTRWGSNWKKRLCTFMTRRGGEDRKVTNVETELWLNKEREVGLVVKKRRNEDEENEK